MSKISINLDSLKTKREWKRHKVKEGSNIYRFLPPFGEKTDGYPYRKWMVIWGLLDPENGRRRPYASSLTTENRCPVYEYVTTLQKIAENKKAEMQASGVSDRDIKESLKTLNKIISNLRPKTVYAWNAVDRSGSVGILEVKSTAQKDIKSLMNAYIRDYNQDPTSVNCDQDDSGVWFNIKREGTGFDTVYSVEKVQTAQKINGQMMYVDDRSALPENVQNNWDKMAFDLTSVYQIKTYDELKDILLANMSLILEECPDAKVPGFDSNGTKISEQKQEKFTKNDIKQPSQDNKPAAKSKINIKLDADDTDDDIATNSIKANTAKVEADSSVDDDFLKMAEDILNE